MDENEVPILDTVIAFNSMKGRLYYYQGNFFHPLWLAGCEIGRVKKAIRVFKKEHKTMIDADRAHPEYKTLVELFDE